MEKKNKAKIIATGASGLVGSRLIELLSPHFDISNVSLETGVNITQQETLTPLLDAPAGTTILHLAAKADVDGCEKDKTLGTAGDAWKINVEGTQNIIDVCRKAGHRLIYISTDFVFSGNSTPESGYSEDDIPDPINWYAQTKYQGEQRVLASGLSFIIARIAYPYRADFPAKFDFVRAIKSRLEGGQGVKAVTDHIMSPTYIDDIAQALQALLENKGQGIYHVVGSQAITPYDACIAIAEVFSLPTPGIEKTTREVFFAGRAPRPFNLTLRNDKIKELGASMKTFEEGLRAMSSRT